MSATNSDIKSQMSGQMRNIIFDPRYPFVVPMIPSSKRVFKPEKIRYDCAILHSDIVQLNLTNDTRLVLMPVRVQYPVQHSYVLETVALTKHSKSFWPRVAVNIKEIWLKWCVRCGVIYNGGVSDCCPYMTLFCREPSPTEITTVITHAGCMDGRGSAWAIHRLFCKLLGHASAISKIKIIESKHESKSESIEGIVAACKGQCVAITDYAFEPKDILKIKKTCSKFILLDHHNSNKLSLINEPNCYFDMEHSGAYLAWNYMATGTPLSQASDKPPLLIQYIQDRDIWKFDLPDSKAISLALRIHSKNYLDDFDTLHTNEEGLFIELAEKGKLYMLSQTFSLDGGNIIGAYKTMFMGLPCVVINTNESPSDVADIILNSQQYANQRLVLVVSWRPLMEIFKINIRSRETDLSIDVGYIASQYWGGGGHPQAAGFTVSSRDSIQTLFEKYPSYEGKRLLQYKYKSDERQGESDSHSAMVIMKMTKYMISSYLRLLSVLLLTSILFSSHVF